MYIVFVGLKLGNDYLCVGVLLWLGSGFKVSINGMLDLLYVYGLRDVLVSVGLLVVILSCLWFGDMKIFLLFVFGFVVELFFCIVWI